MNISINININDGYLIFFIVFKLYADQNRRIFIVEKGNESEDTLIKESYHPEMVLLKSQYSCKVFCSATDLERSDATNTNKTLSCVNFVGINVSPSKIVCIRLSCINLDKKHALLHTLFMMFEKMMQSILIFWTIVAN